MTFQPGQGELFQLKDLFHARSFANALQRTGRPVSLICIHAEQLHPGHIALMQAAATIPRGITVVCSQHKLSKKDQRALSAAKVAAYLHAPEEMLWPRGQHIYLNTPQGSRTEQRQDEINQKLNYIAAVLIAINPSDLFLGEKDREFLLEVHRLIREFHFDVKAHGVPTLRMNDGVPFSHRYRGLSEAETEDLRVLSAALVAATHAADKGPNAVCQVAEEVCAGAGVKLQRVQLLSPELKEDDIDGDAYIILETQVGGRIASDNAALSFS